MTPRDADMLDVSDAPTLRQEWLAPVQPRSLASQTNGYRPVSRHAKRAALLAVGVALVLAGVVVGRATATPRTAPSDSGPWTLLEAPHKSVPPLWQGTVTASPAGLGGASLPPSAPVLTVPEDVEPATSDIGTAAVSGTASWYCGGGSPCTRGYGPSDLIAAIDPTLGIAKGERLTVTYRGRSVVVRVVDVCQCPGSRIVDLSRIAFAQLADPSVGLIRVTVDYGGPSVTPPATDR